MTTSTRRRIWLEICAINSSIATELTSATARDDSRLGRLHDARDTRMRVLNAIGWYDPTPHYVRDYYDYCMLGSPSAHKSETTATKYETTYLLGMEPQRISSVWIESPPTDIVAPLHWDVHDSVCHYYTIRGGWLVDRIYYSVDGRTYGNSDVANGLVVGGPIRARYVQLGIRGFTYRLHSRVKFGI